MISTVVCFLLWLMLFIDLFLFTVVYLALCFLMLLQVKKLPFGHTCGSTNCSKGMANRDWLAEKGKAALEENAR